MSDLFDVKGKAIVITGGAGVLCGTLAKALGRQGAKICIADYDAVRAKEVCKEIEAEGNFAIPVEVNVLEKDKVAVVTGGDNALPVFMRFERRPLAKKLAEYVE